MPAHPRLTFVRDPAFSSCCIERPCPWHGLPVELLDSVAQCLSCSSLVALAQMCPTFCPVAQCVLYCSLSASARSQNLCVIGTLAKKPHVAIFVRSFYIAIELPATVFLASLLRLSEDLVSGRLCPLPRMAPRYGRIVGNRDSLSR